MANHVYFTITVDGLEDGCKAWDKAFPMETHQRKMWNSDETYEVKELVELDKLPMFAHMNLEYDEDGWLKDSYNWYCNNIGAKWCNVEDVEEYYFSGYSAWSAPIQFVQYLHEYLYDHHDKNHSIKMTYEDEFRNFIGVAHYADGYHEIEELESGDLMEELRGVFGDVVDNEDFWDGEYEQGDPSEEMDNIVWEWFENN